jgi:hypothetical protein
MLETKQSCGSIDEIMTAVTIFNKGEYFNAVEKHHIHCAKKAKHMNKTYTRIQNKIFDILYKHY